MKYYAVTIDTETREEVSRVGPFADYDTADEVSRLDNEKNRENHETSVATEVAMDRVAELCQQYIAELPESTDDRREYLQHYIFEAALESLYGSDVWRYVNSMIE